MLEVRLVGPDGLLRRGLARAPCAWADDKDRRRRLRWVNYVARPAGRSQSLRVAVLLNPILGRPGNFGATAGEAFRRAMGKRPFAWEFVCAACHAALPQQPPRPPSRVGP